MDDEDKIIELLEDFFAATETDDDVTNLGELIGSMLKEAADTAAVTADWSNFFEAIKTGFEAKSGSEKGASDNSSIEEEVEYEADYDKLESLAINIKSGAGWCDYEYLLNIAEISEQEIEAMVDLGLLKDITNDAKRQAELGVDEIVEDDPIYEALPDPTGK
jgi:hypothetical protein